MERRTRLILILILLTAAILRFWNFTGPDMVRDDAGNSFRAIGYFDWIASTNTQTTPVTWFPEPVWWQYLSFHDGPPLVFAIQWFFFQIFGDNLFAARLPFVLAGLLSVYFIYLLGNLVAGRGIGLISAFLLAIVNYHIWISRIGLLDGFLLLWIILSLYFFIKARDAPKNYLWWGISAALGMLTKYTFVFILPVFLIALLWQWRGAWRQKWFYAGIIAFIILLSPVIVYNLAMWQARGHPDAALSTLFGLQPEDFIGLSRETSSNLNIFSVANSLGKNFSLGFRLLALLSLLIFIYAWPRDNKRRSYYLISLLGLLFALLIVGLAGGSARFGVIVLPFIALTSAAGVFWIWRKFKKWPKIIFGVLLALIIVWELSFGIQSQLMPQPLAENRFFTAPQKPSWAGYSQLEEYVEEFYTKFPERSHRVFALTKQIRNYQFEKLQALARKNKLGPQQKHLLVYDERMDWAAAVWIIERRRLYDVATIPSLSNLLQAVEDNYIYKFPEFGFQDVYLVMTTDKIPRSEAFENEALARAAKNLEENLEPIREIKNRQGEVIFRVFYLPLDEKLKILIH